MAIGDDFSVAANGDIRHVSGATTYTVLELHRWLQDLADNPNSSGNDLLDITNANPSERATDQIITLLNSFNISDAELQYFYGGSITQNAGDTIYSGLQVLGAVNNTDTELQVIQANTKLTSFWGDQVTPFNGSVITGVLMRVMIKTRVDGADIDGQRCRVQARHWGDSYDFFNVTLGTGESVAAIGTTPDAQNDSTQATVTAWADVLNSGGTANAPTGGWQEIDLGDGSGNQPYYSQWTFGVQGGGLKSLYEYGKDLVFHSNTADDPGSTKSIDGLDGELFLGITHEIPYTALTGVFAEQSHVTWGTEVDFDTGLTTPGTVGEYYDFSVSGAVGKLIALDDDGDNTGSAVFNIEDGTTLNASDVVTRSDATASDGFSVVSITGNGLAGGVGLILADDTTGDSIWIQLLEGGPPSNTDTLYATTTAGVYDVTTGFATASAPVTQTVPKFFLGSFTGTLIGAYGVGVDKDDLSSSDTVEDLDGDTNTPPNNVIFTVSGLVNAEDYVLVGPESGGTLDIAQMTLNTALTTDGVTSVSIVGTEPDNTPATGTLRIVDDAGRHRLLDYSAIAGASPMTWTVSENASALLDDNFVGDEAAATNTCYVTYIDRICDATSEAVTVIYDSADTWFVRIRDGGTAGDSIPNKPFETTAALGTGGGSATHIRTEDA